MPGCSAVEANAKAQAPGHKRGAAIAFRLQSAKLLPKGRWLTPDAPSRSRCWVTLKTIARELVQAVRGNVTIDWTIRENVRAKMRVIVKRILRRHGYPPDKQEQATQTVLEQAQLLSADWAQEAA
jgi:hypothetical protein